MLDSDAPRIRIKNTDWIVHLVLLFVGGVFLVEAWRLGVGTGRSPGSGFLPFYTGIALSLVALGSLLRNLLSKDRTQAAAKPANFFGPQAFHAAGVVAALLVYVLALPWLGYPVSTLAVTIALFKLAGFRSWIAVFSCSFLTVFLSHLVFDTWLGLRLPRGVLALWS